MKKYYLLILFFVTQLFIGQTPTGGSAEVGVTEGQLAISNTGGAIYTIPIAIPPGINGVVPQVKLAYNSQSGNGIAGYGWNLSGISTITRIPRTKFHDGVIGGVNFDSNDRFAFDGQRLMIKSGTIGIYGSNLTIYETENFSNVKITSMGVSPLGANYGPAYFLVEYPDGSKAYYGNSIDSLSKTDWAITYWENPQGVRISYNYALINNILSISSINYGSITTATPINKIQFIYKTRQRPEKVYIGGQSFLRNTILSQIIVLGNGVGFRNYSLNQDVTSLGYERLVNITETSGDGTKTYNPTVFSYPSTIDAITYTPITTTINLNNTSSSNSATVTGDFNGDGKMDFIIYPTTGTASKTKYWLYYNIDPNVNPNLSYEGNPGSFQEIFASSMLTGDANTGYKMMPKQGWSIIKKNTSNTTSTAAIDNTYTFSNYSAEGGLNPILQQYQKSYQFPVFTWSFFKVCGSYDYANYITYSYNVPKKFISGDFNGDGLTDVIAIEKSIFYTYSCNSGASTAGGQTYLVNLDKRLTTNFVTNSGTIVPSGTDNYKIADFNGDGKTDLFVFNTNTVRVYSLNDSNQFILLYQNTTADTNIDISKPILMGDYNGDGKFDFIIPKGAGYSEWYKYTSTGNNIVKQTQTYDGFNYPVSNSFNTFTIIPTDYNNDGKTDLLLTRSTRNSANTLGNIGVTCYINKNDTFSLTSNPYIGNSGDQSGIDIYSLPVFLSSDQPNMNLEIAFINKNLIYRFASQKDFSKEKLLQSITTGNGVKESITYHPLVTDPCPYNCNPLYSPSSPIENYPNMDIPVAPSFQVVSKLEKIRNNVAYKEQLYEYYGAVSNLEGLGFLGFRSSMQTNWHDGSSPTSIISSISKFDIGLRGANTENYSVLYLFSPYSSFAPTNYISKSVLGYNTATDALQANKVFKLQNTSSQTFNGLDNTSSQTTIGYDSYNNPTNSTTTVSNGATIEQTTISNIEYATSTVTPYVIGRPISKEQSVTIAGDATTNKELYIYTNHLLSQVKKYGNGNGIADFITEDNTYDAFGNITQKTITVPAVSPNPAAAPRTTYYEYDPSGRFLTKSTDIKGLSTTFAYNGNNGLLNSETNPYSLTNSYLYDSWFKKIKTTDYLGNSNTYTYTRTGNVNTLVTTTGDDGSASQETFDDLGRKITFSVKDISGNLSSISYLYDLYDRNIKKFEPNSSSQWNETQYDVYGRVNKTISFTGKTVTINYSELTTTINDGAKTKTSIKNSLGNVISITDTPGGTINYTYFANRNLKSSNYDGVITTLEQDGWGRKTKLTDPSAGTYTYAYNGFGETISETTPNGTTAYALNDVGKITAKNIVGNPVTLTNSSTTYAYDGTTKLLTSSIYTNLLEGSTIITNTYEYDSYKRLNKTTEATPFATFVKQLTFDAFGRAATETTSGSANGKTSSKTIKNIYKNSYPWQILDNTTQQVVWQTNTVNARGQLLTALLGNGITITNTYDQYGFASKFKHDRTLANPGNMMTLNTVFDPIKGNLISRTNSMFSTTDNFSYDSLDRLTSYPNAQSVLETQAYDDRGRITQNNLGTYNYTNTTKAYHNTSVTLNTDADAYYMTKPTQNISYNTFKSPIEIEDVGIDKISFTYNDSNSRSTMFYGGLGLKETRQFRKYYSADGSMEIKQNMNPGGATEFITYIGGDGYSAPIVLKSDGTNQNYLYLHRDYQGSILAITDANGAVVEKRLFDAWGAIAKVEDSASNTLNFLLVLDRGYTGHEHLQSVGLINMNGRIYDPKLHRFLQPDNYVQEPFNTQNYNRYGYCINNPLKYTDKNGEFFGTIISALVDGIKNIFTHGVNINNYDWNRTSNAWKIDMGLFKGNFGQIFNRFTWESPQTFIGWATISFHNIFGGVKSVSYYNEATVVETYSRDWGAFTLGSFITGEREITNKPNDYLFQHEYGHVLQSHYAGLLYLPKYAIPSLTSKGNHNLFWTETDANVRALTFFTSNDKNFKTWHFEEKFNPIPGYDPSKPFDDLDNQKALLNNTTNLTRFETGLNNMLSYLLLNFNNNQNEPVPSDFKVPKPCNICN